LHLDYYRAKGYDRQQGVSGGTDTAEQGQSAALGELMKLSRPKEVTFIVAVIIVIVAVLLFVAKTNPVPDLNAFWVLFVGFVVLAMGNLMRNL
jgi:hypothetical protein